MRIRIRGLATALAGLVITTSGAGAQGGPGAPGTMAGVVADSVTGLPVADAPVRLEAGRAVFTDSAGRFLLKGVPREGKISIDVDQPGYDSYFAMVDAVSPQLTVRLVPHPGALRGLRTIDAELRQAVGLRGNTRFFGRKELMSSNARDVRDFLLHHGVYAPQRSPYASAPGDLIQQSSGGATQTAVYIDGIGYPNIASMPTFDMNEIYALVVVGSGVSVSIWSTAYIERLARTIGHLR
jgi:hypothetical protein